MNVQELRLSEISGVSEWVREWESCKRPSNAKRLQCIYGRYRCV